MFYPRRPMPSVMQPIVAGVALSFGYELIRAVSNGLSQLLFRTTIDAWVSPRIGGGSA